MYLRIATSIFNLEHRGSMFLRNVSVYHLNLEERSTVFFRNVAVSTFKFEDKGRIYLLTYLLDGAEFFLRI